jgi:hypothetical protein
MVGIMTTETLDHEKAVSSFFKKCQMEDAERFAEVCRRYPVLTHKKIKQIKENEVPYEYAEEESGNN